MVNNADVADSLRFAALHLSRALRGSGSLGESRFCVLTVLARGPMTVSELAAHERVSLPTMSKLISAMVEAGLVRRERDAIDNRKTAVTMTDAGRVALESASLEGAAWLIEHFGTLEGDDIATLDRAARIMTAMITR
ncbi:MarR family transcriptional regulator [Flaviflexus huanghaiensis]|uniref:MarR family transcriptional regulator n=1 Tax=Flaviflexus huanghaiensis TaxID=1111473 RepID=UPI0015FA50F2